MTLQELRYLVALVDTGHFGQAAERCHISQSTLSTQIKKLEAYLGITVFDRSLKRVHPTPIGREIVESARLILSEVDRIRELAKYGQDPMALTLHLGIIPTLGPYYLPHVLPTLHQRYPNLKLLLSEVTTTQMLAQLHEGKLAAGLLALPIDTEGLSVATLFNEPFMAALPSTHPLAKKTKISLAVLSAENLLLLDEGHCLRDQALAVCGLESRASEEVRATSLETLRQMVGIGIGVTLLPLLACPHGTKNSRDAVAIRPLTGTDAGRTVALVWRKRTPYFETLNNIAQTLSAHLPPGVKAVSSRKKSTPAA
jgi:LysR family hydrogen peroxide-inducible transcriptional activator